MTKKKPVGTVLARGRITYPATTPDAASRAGLNYVGDLGGIYRLSDPAGNESKDFWLSHSDAKRAWNLASSSAGKKWDNEIEIVSYLVAGSMATRLGVRRSTRSSLTEVTPTTTKDEMPMKGPSDDFVHYSGKIEEYQWTKTETGNRRMIVSVKNGPYARRHLPITPDLVQVVEEAFILGREVEIYDALGRETVSNDTQFLVRFSPAVKIVARGVPCGYHYSRAARNNKPYFTIEMPDDVCMYKCYGPVDLSDVQLVKNIVDDDESLEVEVYVDPKTGDLRVRPAEK